mmetsp:Transcript_16524/g.39202  ORF Transcript_16524/g.39202 Transcript_16524/m.39202 type:complete len:417 (-) Transcript_16524:49-1299(-)
MPHGRGRPAEGRGGGGTRTLAASRTASTLLQRFSSVMSAAPRERDSTRAAPSATSCSSRAGEGSLSTPRSQSDASDPSLLPPRPAPDPENPIGFGGARPLAGPPRLSQTACSTPGMWGPNRRKRSLLSSSTSRSARPSPWPAEVAEASLRSSWTSPQTLPMSSSPSSNASPSCCGTAGWPWLASSSRQSSSSSPSSSPSSPPMSTRSPWLASPRGVMLLLTSSSRRSIRDPRRSPLTSALYLRSSCWTSRLNDASEVRPGRCCPAARCVRLASATGREGTTVVGPACGLLGRGDARFPDISSHTVGMLSSGWGLPPRCSAPASPFPASPIRQAPVSSSTAASTAPRATYAMASSSSRAAARRSRCSLRRAAAADDTCQSCSCRPSRGTRRRIISVRRPALEHTGNQLDKLSSLPML